MTLADFDKLYTHEVDIRHENYVKLQERIQKAADKANGKHLEPILDSDGRYHAPCDGYKFFICHLAGSLSDLEEKIYAGGQYLPYENFDEGKFYGEMQFRHKLMVPATFWKEVIDSNYWLKRATAYEPSKIYQYNGFDVRNIWFFFTKWELGHIIPIFNVLLEQAEEEKPVLPPKPPKGIAPEGRQSVTGTILNYKEVDGPYGSVSKILIELENYSTIWGTFPSIDVYDEGPNRELWLKAGGDFRGMKITFTATFEHANKNGVVDVTHSFFKYPKKAKYI
jgi:hypothetical protein